jgi:hypothetical protein
MKHLLISLFLIAALLSSGLNYLLAQRVEALYAEQQKLEALIEAVSTDMLESDAKRATAEDELIMQRLGSRAILDELIRINDGLNAQLSRELNRKRA